MNNPNDPWQQNDDQHSGWDESAPSPAQGANVLGIVGFIFAFCLPPLGLILSLIALTKRPRGFAIAGTAIGVLGSLVVAGCLTFGLVMWDGLRMMIGVGGLPQALEQIRAQQGEFPDSLDSLDIPEWMRTDAWGTNFRYEQLDDGNAWRITLAGPDRQFDTDDDIVISSEMRDSEIQRIAQDIFEQWVESR